MYLQPFFNPLASLLRCMEIAAELLDIKLFGKFTDLRAGNRAKGDKFMAVEERLGGQIFARKGTSPVFLSL